VNCIVTLSGEKTAMQFTVQYDIPESIVETLQQHWPMIAEKI